MIPIFVVDRPFSLKILEGLTNYRNQFGILSHAFTSANFKEKFKMFPLTDIKIGDSGIYQGREKDYDSLFREYLRMGVNYGIIKDYYRDPQMTLKSAEEAIKVYHAQGYYNNFKLVGVAQGRTVEEYVENYAEQKKMGYEMVAIGGMLDKIDKHKRLVKVKQEELLIKTLKTIRAEYPKDRLFPLGTFNRYRIGFFKEVGVWGADYKGWIFKYNVKESHLRNNRLQQVQHYIETQIFPLIQKNRLLIMSCSERKKNKTGPAIEVYDGPAYRMVRRYLQNNDGLDVRIISGKYGLISKDTIISTYNAKLTKENVLELRKKYASEMKVLSSAYDKKFVYGSKLYRSALMNGDSLKHTEGKIGQQLSQLKKWLYNE